MLRNPSPGIEASATGESLNSGDVAVHPAARHMPHFELTGDAKVQNPITLARTITQTRNTAAGMTVYG